MQLYLDTSALTKLVVVEPETNALEAFLADHAIDDLFVAALARTELIRAVLRRGLVEAVPHAHRLLSRIHLTPLNSQLLDRAGMLPPASLRTLDAVHLAAAQAAPDLRALVTYDTRLADAADSLGIRVATPGYVR